MQCYTAQRDPEAFPDPERWDPSRWLRPSEKADAKRAKELFMPFSKGPRARIGINMAIMELKVTTATMVLHTQVSVAPDTNDESMVMMDRFLALPKGGKCDLQFEPIKA